MWLSGVWMRPDTMRAISEAIRSFGLVALDPLVAGLSTHTVAQAELGVRKQAARGLENEIAYVRSWDRSPTMAWRLLVEVHVRI